MLHRLLACCRLSVGLHILKRVTSPARYRRTPEGETTNGCFCFVALLRWHSPRVTAEGRNRELMMLGPPENGNRTPNEDPAVLEGKARKANFSRRNNNSRQVETMRPFSYTAGPHAAEESGLSTREKTGSSPIL